MSTFKKSLSTSLIIAMGFVVPALSFAEEKVPEATAVDCVSAAEIAAMTEEQKATLALPVCADGATEEKSVESPAIVK